MRLNKALFCSSIGKKFWMALTGLGLGLFMVLHVSGNMLLFLGPQAYNLYTYHVEKNPVTPIVEVLLIIGFVIHVYLGITLTLQNRAARGTSPARRPTSWLKAASFPARSMILTGLLIFVFVILHLMTFKFGPRYEVTYDGVVMRDLYRLVIERLSDPLYAAWYLFSMVVLGAHLSHGFSATMQSLGISGVRNPKVKRAGLALAFLIAAGFFSQPILALLVKGK